HPFFDVVVIAHGLLQAFFSLGTPVHALPEVGQVQNLFAVLGIDAVDAQALAVLLLEGAFHVALFLALNALEALQHPGLVFGIDLGAQEVAGLAADDELAVPDLGGHAGEDGLHGAAGAQIGGLVPMFFDVLGIQFGALGIDVGFFGQELIVAVRDALG